MDGKLRAEVLELASTTFRVVDGVDARTVGALLPVVRAVGALVNAADLHDDLGLELCEYAQLKSEGSALTKRFRAGVVTLLDEAGRAQP